MQKVDLVPNSQVVWSETEEHFDFVLSVQLVNIHEFDSDLTNVIA